MNRRSFISRMTFVALGSGLLGSELQSRAPKVEALTAADIRWNAITADQITAFEINQTLAPSIPRLESRLTPEVLGSRMSTSGWVDWADGTRLEFGPDDPAGDELLEAVRRWHQDGMLGTWQRTVPA